jgi:ribonuclease E
VQLTRKKLGTGLIEAFSTTCTHCGGRGIVLHGDPVDAGPSAGRKPESGGGRRGKRGKKGGKAEDDVQVAKVPAHAAGEHPMFKAMAAANGRPEDDEGEDVEGATAADEVVVLDPDTIREAVVELAEEDLVDDDLDDTDEESDDEDDSEDEDSDEIDLDDDDEEDDDIEVIDGDSDEDDSDEDDEDSDDFDDDEDDSEDDSADDEDEDDDESLVAASSRPRRRRAAARPAGPPVHDG